MGDTVSPENCFCGMAVLNWRSSSIQLSTYHYHYQYYYYYYYFIKI